MILIFFVHLRVFESLWQFVYITFWSSPKYGLQYITYLNPKVNSSWLAGAVNKTGIPVNTTVMVALRAVKKILYTCAELYLKFTGNFQIVF